MQTLILQISSSTANNVYIYMYLTAIKGIRSSGLLSYANCLASWLRRRLHRSACPGRRSPFLASRGRGPARRMRLATRASRPAPALHPGARALAGLSSSKRAPASQKQCQKRWTSLIPTGISKWGYLYQTPLMNSI